VPTYVNADIGSVAGVNLATDPIDELTAAAADAAESGRVAESERLARQAVDLAERLAPGRERDRAVVGALRQLGTALRSRGRLTAAERTFDRALVSAERTFGPESPEVAELLNDLGMTFRYAGRFGDAELAYRRALAVIERAADVDREDLAAVFHNLGGLAHARGDFEAAEPLARRAVEIRSSVVGPGAVATLLDRSAHAATLHAVGRSAEAEASIRDLLGDLEAALGADHPEVAVALNNLAAIVQRRGELAEADRKSVV